MKVLHIIDGIGPPGARGPELIYAHLKKLAERGIDVHILTLITDRYTCSSWFNWANEQKNKYNIKIYFLPNPFIKCQRRIYNIYVVISRIFYFFKALILQWKNHYDIINDFSSSSFMFYRTALLGLFCRAKLIHTLCTYNVGFFSSHRFLGGIKYLDRVLCLSKDIKNKIIRLSFSDNKVIYFPLGIDIKRFSQVNSSVNVRKKYALPTNKLIVLYLGPIESHKGIFVLAEASCKIPESTNLHFVFACARFWVSESERVKMIKDLKESMRRSKHTFKIITDLVNVPSLMDISDIFVLPQLTPHGTIAYPVTLLEAMASGKSIIASRTEGVNELIIHNRNGLMFTPGCSTELASHIQTLAENPKLRKEIGNRARTDIKNKYNLDSAISDLIEIYCE